jgi:hypothetical protein
MRGDNRTEWIEKREGEAATTIYSGDMRVENGTQRFDITF